MAKQHLYSRVPAKYSMYNRCDSFDTFAHSEGLTREFVERELSCTYANKLSKNDAEAIRKGQMPLVYSQCTLRSGQLAQTCVHYLPTDYTGERSSYLSHTLILTEEEQKQLLHNPENAVFNPGMFPSDISNFDFTSSLSAAGSSYPEAVFLFTPVENTSELIKQYDPDIFKQFLRAIFAVLCAKGKPVYCKLDHADAETSEQALRLFNTVMTVVPFHLRKNLSFATYVTDPSQYAHVKVKCLSGDCAEVSPAKGMFFDFHTGLVTGQLPKGIMDYFPAEFFYFLLENPALRNTFLGFIDSAVKVLPALEKLSVKALSDLVFLFCGANEMFAQADILPSDAKVYDFLCVYEKYRSVLDTESRKRVYACLDRYPARHEAIPKNIFSKLSRLYPGEPDSVKQIAIRAVLELLHTDIMRERLFTFIKNNYSDEHADIRAAINSDLCRVYYGGFLQSQILAFFSEHFAEESEATQYAVLEKVLLTIRTAAIQPNVLAFIHTNYPSFTARQKQLFYSVFFEMLPECDSLSALLVDLVNAHIPQDSTAQQVLYRQKLQQLVLADQQNAERKLLPLLCQNSGFCCNTVLETAFCSQVPEEIYCDCIEILAQKSVFRRSEELLRLSNLSMLNPSITNKLLQILPLLFAQDSPSANLFEWLEADQLAAQSQKSNVFAIFFRDTIILPAVASTLMDVFDAKLFPDGMDIIKKYALENTCLQDTPQYKTLVVFWNLDSAINNKHGEMVFRCLHVLDKEAAKPQMAAYLRNIFTKKESFDVVQYILCQMSISYLRDGNLLPKNLYSESRNMCLQQVLQTQKTNSSRKIAEQEASFCAAEHILHFLVIACRNNDLFLQMLNEHRLALYDFLSELYANCGSGSKKKLLSYLSDAPEALYVAVETGLDHIRPTNSSILSKLFGKKR